MVAPDTVMFLVMHSLSEVLRYLSPIDPIESNKRIQNSEKIMGGDLHEENVCPTCRHCYDQVSPLPSEELRRRSSAHNAYSSDGGKSRALRLVPSVPSARHKSDNLTSRLLDVTTKSSNTSVVARIGLSRNPSDPKLQTIGKEDIQSSPGGSLSALPRTLSTSVLRIKQRRSFWEKFVK